MIARVAAQAKINLLLHVLDREVSGYHSIETVFLRLDLADDVRVRVAPGRSLDCAGPSIPSDGLGPVERNLAYRAATAYAEATGWPSGFAVEIIKRIPVGGGLGGGSADAGAVLRALDALSPHPLGGRLPSLATALGADVPFMSIDSPMAVGWGRGERLLTIPALDSRHTLLVVPSVPVSTADAYGWLSADRGTYTPTARVLPLASFRSWAEVAGRARNDFERPVSARQPVIAELTARLTAADAMVAMLSGSGSTVFGIRPRNQDLSSLPNSGASGVKTLPTRTSTRVHPVEILR